MHELLYAAAPAAVGGVAGLRLWIQRRARRRRPAPPGEAFDLRGTDGRRHALADLEEPAVVLLFMSNRCPGVKAYDARLKRMLAAYRGRVAFVGINPIDERLYPREDLRGMRAALHDRGLDLLYLKDPRGTVARAYDVVCTPEVVLLDAGRRIRYQGRIDDSMVERTVRRRYLEDAIAAVLRGGAPRVPWTAPLGCSIEAAVANPIVVGARARARASV